MSRIAALLRSGASADRGLAWLSAQLIWLALLVLVFAVFSFGPWLLSAHPALIIVCGIAGPASMLLGARWMSRRIARESSGPAARDGVRGWVGRVLHAAQAPAVWAAIIGLGLLLRLLWASTVPVAMVADAASFLETAQRLAAGASYSNLFQDVDGSLGRPVYLLAWRPPGLPYLLAGWFILFGDSNPSIAGFNAVIYLATAATLAWMAVAMMGRVAVATVLLIFALWPKHIAYGALPMTEAPSLLLLLLAVGLFHRALTVPWPWALLAGLGFGLGTLVRPSYQLLPLIWLHMAWLWIGAWRRPAITRAISVLLVASLGGAALVAPWTLRNQQVLGKAVLVSTNGGDVLYRSNNPLASGSFTPRGERDLNALIDDEVLWDATGSAWAKEWILAHPREFALLGVRKLGRFWGAEEDGNTLAFFPTLQAASGAVAVLFNGVMNAWWLLLCWAVGVALLCRRAALTASPLAVAGMAAILLLSAVHGVYESHPRYHFPIVGFLILIACTGWFGLRRAVTAHESR